MKPKQLFTKLLWRKLNNGEQRTDESESDPDSGRNADGDEENNGPKNGA